ncbi:MAG: DUF421 domain-containing protein [Maioricimonas sp. JB049]
MAVSVSPGVILRQQHTLRVQRAGQRPEQGYGRIVAAPRQRRWSEGTHTRAPRELRMGSNATRTMFEKWITADLNAAPLVILSGVVTYTAILLYTRIVGLRTFSKMSAADFAMTIAVGSMFGSTISTSDPALLLGLVALGVLFAGQWLTAWLRRQTGWFTRWVDNQPLLLMAHGEIIEENLTKANITRSDIHAKLRESNALTYDQVLAVVFETTGDISVLHSEQHGARVEPDFLKDVAGADRLFQNEPVP